MNKKQLQSNILCFTRRVGSASIYGISVALGTSQREVYLAVTELVRLGLLKAREVGELT